MSSVFPVTQTNSSAIPDLLSLGLNDTSDSSSGDTFASLLSLAQPGSLGSSATPDTSNPMAVGNMGSDLQYLLMMSMLNVVKQMLNKQPAASQAPLWPVKGQVTQEFHDGHKAMDIAVPTGTPVQSTMPGKVIHAGWNDEGYGNLVIVENGAYRTYYAHLSSIPVKLGDTVAAGSIIGLSGSTGNSTGPHVHYEVRVNNVEEIPAISGLG
jgi:murein DD-endopeptidase MepM/ murein hydrolase activator NlpD